jgi:hypothetical protein
MNNVIDNLLDVLIICLDVCGIVVAIVSAVMMILSCGAFIRDEFFDGNYEDEDDI